MSVLPVYTSHSYSDEINLGPLFYYNYADDNKSINALGPFISYKEIDSYREFGFRPIFYESHDINRDKKNLDVLYPFFGYRSYEEDWGFQFLAYLLSFQSDYKDSYTTRKFNLFPFVFSSFSENEKEDYFALFPIYGKMNNRFLKDEIRFILFPLYLQTKKNNSVNNNILWPFFGYASGKGEEGFKIWPIYGYKKRESEKLDEKFVLWPFYTKRNKKFYDDNIRIKSVLPFYSEYESDEKTQKSYLWPFINYYEDRKNDIYRYDVPWPLINYTKGKKYEKRVFPLYSREEYENDEEGFILWPLYRYKTINLDNYSISRKSFLLFLYKDIAEIPTDIDGRNSRRVELWPIFSYKRDREGNKYIRILSLLEPFLPDNKPIENNFSSFWRIYEKNISSEGKVITNILWNTYRSETYRDTKMIKISPVIPLFEYKRDNNVRTYKMLGGFVSINRVKVSSDKEMVSNIIN